MRFLHHLNILSYVFPVTEEFRQRLLGAPFFPGAFQHLQLGSDIQIYLTGTGIPPPPALLDVRIYPTVFVKVFIHLLIIDVKIQERQVVFLSPSPPSPPSSPPSLLSFPDHADE